MQTSCVFFDVRNEFFRYYLDKRRASKADLFVMCKLRQIWYRPSETPTVLLQVRELKNFNLWDLFYNLRII